jgi:Ca2+-binding RTX toxin-like protein
LKWLGDTTIDTGAGDDYVVIGWGNYTINLGSGNNILDGGNAFGNVSISAGNGDDIIDVEGFATFQVNAGGGNNRIYLAGNASVSAGSGDDIITTLVDGLSRLVIPSVQSGGTPYEQEIKAGKGDNQIELPVYGETTIKTGSGQDFILAASVSSAFLGKVNSDIVNIFTGSGDDTVVTIDTKSLIRLGSGNDTVIAGAGDDTIYAGSGQNTINLRGDVVSVPAPLDNLGFLGPQTGVRGGGNDTVYLNGGHDTIVLGSSGFATIYGFGCNDLLDVRGLNASFTRSGGDTLISAGSNPLGVLKGFTGSVGLV